MKRSTMQPLSKITYTRGLLPARLLQPVKLLVLDVHSTLPRVGIGITARNRPTILANTLDQLKLHTPPEFPVVVVDDASEVPLPQATARFDENVGIARAKNKCLELLDDAGCDHFFLFDDDCYPIADDWWKPYVDSPEPHLMYGFKDFFHRPRLGDTTLLYRDSRHVAWSHARGCLLYATREVLEKVGGMDPCYGLWGYEHGAWSNRINAAGLTSWRFADVVGSEQLIHSMDEYEEVGSVVPTEVRTAHLIANAPRYWGEKNELACHFIPYREQYDIVLACWFTRNIDPQRGIHGSTDLGQFAPLLDSLGGRVPLVLLHDELEPADVPGVCFEQVETTEHLNCYQQRAFHTGQWLKAHPEIRYVWCVDATDVQMLRDPFPEMKPNTLYIGCEEQPLGSDWMRTQHRGKIVADFIAANSHLKLLNAGLVGGEAQLVADFYRDVARMFFDNLADRAFKSETESLGPGDMAATNYVARSPKWAERISFGSHVNTVFKGFEENNHTAWWKHK